MWCKFASFSVTLGYISSFLQSLSLEADRLDGVSMEGLVFGHIEIELKGEICLILSLLSWCYEAFLNPNLSFTPFTWFLRNGAVGVSVDVVQQLVVSGVLETIRFVNVVQQDSM